jgi:hypothetical protein
MAPSSVYGADAIQAAVGFGESSASYEFHPAISGQYQIFEWHPVGANQFLATPLLIEHAGSVETAYYDQSINGGRWNLVGAYDFISQQPARIHVLNSGPDAGRSLAADAFSLVYVPTPPIFTLHPVSAQVSPHAVHTLSVAARSNLPVRYQWQKDGFAIVGATGASYTISDFTSADAGSYRVVAVNDDGYDVSDSASLLLVGDAPTVTFTVDADGLTLTWPTGGVLQAAPNVEGPYEDIVTGNSPFRVMVNGEASSFFRIRY